MAKVPAFHSRLPNDRNVYHDNDRCTEGNNIEPRKPGIRYGRSPALRPLFAARLTIGAKD